MSIFEDLIEELKEEHLLEQTVIETGRENSAPAAASVSSGPARKEKEDFSYFDSPEAEEAFLEKRAATQGEDFYRSEEFNLSAGAALPAAPVTALPAERPAAPVFAQAEPPRNQAVEKEFFRKRAMEEVTGLQMVEHVLTGIERDQLEVAPKPYDDLPVKLALHDFMQIAAETKSPEHAQAEFRLMQETENWYSLLSRRDQYASVENLRRFCETTKPALSTSALVALARFYRNSPYTEAVRSKFDLIVTRLFAHEGEAGERELPLSRDEMVLQLKELYADWSSIQLYAAEEDSELHLLRLKFEDFVGEARAAKSFDDLIASELFARYRDFKHDCHENFFAPVVAVAAVETNVELGNRFLHLLEKASESSSVAHLEEKYGFLHDQLVSDVTGRTYQLGELLKSKTVAKSKPAEIVDIKVKATAASPYKRRVEDRPSGKMFGVSRWLIALTVFTLLVCGGLYVWAQMQETAPASSASVQKINLENTMLKDYLQTARVSDETFYGITQSAWEELNGERKEELLRKILLIGPERGFKKVHLISSGGKSVGFASAEKVEVYAR